MTSSVAAVAEASSRHGSPTRSPTSRPRCHGSPSAIRPCRVGTRSVTPPRSH